MFGMPSWSILFPLSDSAGTVLKQMYVVSNILNPYTHVNEI